ncbi:hypothetical protein BN874_30005 [Candidatus Contendobacter odensis Run_B_J11]|uniref:Uncharacterized protein n=1 Tax=Candidatus Contendobacter odensis Run_B_J11 TaxID=1400861 RepID=A0A7U7J449_9GAMM|nr:hypothetical protein BN874_30005 [Candidatus Contendobacter odensis Run_B_J11]
MGSEKRRKLWNASRSINEQAPGFEPDPDRPIATLPACFVRWVPQPLNIGLGAERMSMLNAPP